MRQKGKLLEPDGFETSKPEVLGPELLPVGTPDAAPSVVEPSRAEVAVASGALVPALPFELGAAGFGASKELKLTELVGTAEPETAGLEASGSPVATELGDPESRALRSEVSIDADVPDPERPAVVTESVEVGLASEPEAGGPNVGISGVAEFASTFAPPEPGAPKEVTPVAKEDSAEPGPLGLEVTAEEGATIVVS